MKEKDVKFIGSEEYKERMKADKSVQRIMKFCKDNNMNLQGFVDKSDPNAAKTAMTSIFNSITGDDDAK